MMTEKEIELKLEEYKGLIISTASKYKIYGMDFDDIYQELCMQFVKALQDHDSNKNANLKTLFITYATNWLKVILKSQSYHKRGIPLRIDNEEIEDGDRYVFIMSKEPTPDDIEYAERLEEEMAKGTIEKMEPIQFLLNMISLINYPFTIRPLLQLDLKLSDAEFKRILSERKEIILNTLFK